MPQISIIGDITIDNFISLNSDYIYTNCRISDKDCELVLPYGGKIPVQDVEVHCGGNAANVSIGLTRLGIKIFPIIPLGKDIYSTIALGTLGKEGITLDPSYINENYKCNSSYIFRYEGDRTIFSHHEIKDYPLPSGSSPEYLYLSSHSGDNNKISTEVLTTIKKSNIKLLFAPSNTQMRGDKDILEALINNSFLLICNKEEAHSILSIIDEPEFDINNMLHRFHHFGSHHVVITEGANGVSYFDADTEKTFHVDSILDNDSIVDSTGAGDAMCTGVIYSLINKLPIKDGVELGLRNSISVLQKIGAQTGLLYKNS